MRHRALRISVAAGLAFVAACGSSSGSEGGPDVLVAPDAPPTISESDVVIELTPTPIEFATPSEGSGSTAPPDGELPEGRLLEGNDLLAPLDKQNYLSSNYVPADLAAIPARLDAPGFGGQRLRVEAIDALIEMLDRADQEGFTIRVASAFRSYATQASLFNGYVASLGEAEASRISARPGHSEHQLGTTVDLSSASIGWALEEGFGSTEEGLWLADHAHEYGFALSYPAGGEDVTGYAYEPWHFRYIEGEAATEWKSSGLTLREFLASR